MNEYGCFRTQHHFIRKKFNLTFKIWIEELNTYNFDHFFNSTEKKKYVELSSDNYLAVVKIRSSLFCFRGQSNYSKVILLYNIVS